MWLLFSCPSQTASHRYWLFFTKYQYPPSNKKHTSWIRAQKSLWRPPPLSQLDTHSEMTEHAHRKHLAASGRTAALPQKWAHGFSVVGLPFRIILPRPLHHSSQWRCSSYFAAPTQPLPPQDSSTHTPALGTAGWWLTAQPLFGNCPWREQPRPRSHPLPSQVSAHQRLATLPPLRTVLCSHPNSRAHPGGWLALRCDGDQPRTREASLCPILLSSLPHPKSFSY